MKVRWDPFQVRGLSLAKMQKTIRSLSPTPAVEQIAISALHNHPKAGLTLTQGSGGSVNTSQMWHSFNQAWLWRKIDKRKSEAAWNAGLEYLRQYKAWPGDGLHRHAEGALIGLQILDGYAGKRMSKDVRDKTRAVFQDVIREHGKAAIAKLEYCLEQKYYHVRILSRALGNTAMYLGWIRYLGVKYYENPSSLLFTLERGIRFLLETTSDLMRLTDDMVANGWEFPGWAVSSDGIWFQVDHLDRFHFKDTHNSYFQPFVAFYLQPAALRSCLETWKSYKYLNMESYQDVVNLIMLRLSMLEKWFWAYGYRDHPDPLHRGMGPTEAVPLLEDGFNIGKPMRLRMAETKGRDAAFYPCWQFGEVSLEKRMRLFESHVLQIDTLYGRNWLTRMLFAPEFLKAAKEF